MPGPAFAPCADREAASRADDGAGRRHPVACEPGRPNRGAAGTSVPVGAM